MRAVGRNSGRGNLPTIAAVGAVAVLGVAVISISLARRDATRDSTGTQSGAGTVAGAQPGVGSGAGRVAPIPRGVEPVVTTYAGSGARGFADGTGRDAVFNRPADLVFDRAGNILVADAGNDLIRKIGPDGAVSVFAGSGEKGFTDGTSKSARFNAPTGLAVAADGAVYVADTGNDLIRKISPDGVVTTLAGSGEKGFTDGKGRAAKLNAPSGIVLDKKGNLFVSDTGNDVIRKIAPGGEVTTFAGKGERGFADGDLREAKFNAPSGLSFDSGGNLFIADAGNDIIRKINPSGAVTTYAGAGERGFAEGDAKSARFNAPSGIVIDGAGAVFVVDQGNDLLRRISPDGEVSTFAGAGERGFFDGAGRAAQFNAPTRILLDPAGPVYVADEGNNQIRRLTFDSQVTTLAGSGAIGFADGARRDAIFNRPAGAAVDGAGNLYVADAGNDIIRKVLPDGTVTTFSGSGVTGFTDGPATSAKFNSPAGITMDIFGALFVADQGNDKIRMIQKDGTVTFVAGSGVRGYQDGPATTARFNNPAAVAVDFDGNVYVADQGNDVIRKITPDGQVSTLAGTGERGHADGKAQSARFNAPAGIAVDGAGNIFVADTGNDQIRRITPDGDVSTFAGSERGFVDGQGKAAKFNAPTRLSFDHSGNLWVADAGNDIVRRVSPDAAVVTVAGTGERGYADGQPGNAQFNTPAGVAVDMAGTIYVVDQGNGIIRKMTAGVK
ncbi:MAG: SMP-30/gluconolactonase/LRE family protein [Chloroflexi bacterium]|nr:SMP-30/gluconolactonase/LRE family protein [Chloroflexota bacterium]